MIFSNRDGRSPWQKEIDSLKIKEKKFAEKRMNRQDSALNQFLANKVPDKLQATLDSAFAKAFEMIFEKGTQVIEKTYKKDEMEKEHKVDLYANEIHQNRKSLNVFTQKSKKDGLVNLSVSGLAGVGMGLLGVGLPDIPVFTGMVLKSVYETALRYGFEYESDKERYFVLMIIEGAVSGGEHFSVVNRQIDEFITLEELPESYNTKTQIKAASGVLSKELLYMKFLQGVPVVGAVGGAYDAIYMKQISEYARIKYHKRFLLKMKES